MNPFKLIEEKIFLGEIMCDYGIIEERVTWRIRRTRVSLLLCRKNNNVFLAIKESNIMPLAAGVRYILIHEPQVKLFKHTVDAAYSKCEVLRAMMKPFNRSEENKFLGEIVRDYGIVEERRTIITHTKVSLLLCRKKNNFFLAIKESNTAPLAFNISYIFIHQPQLAVFKTTVNDAHNRIYHLK